jgi:hypothetical protein
MEKMTRPITLALFVLIAALAVGITLVDRMRERASHDRFSLDDWSVTEMVAR